MRIALCALVVLLGACTAEVDGGGVDQAASAIKAPPLPQATWWKPGQPIASGQTTCSGVGFYEDPGDPNLVHAIAVNLWAWYFPFHYVLEAKSMAAFMNTLWGGWWGDLTIIFNVFPRPQPPPPPPILPDMVWQQAEQALAAAGVCY